MFFLSVNNQFSLSHELIPILFTPHPELLAFRSQMHSWLLNSVMVLGQDLPNLLTISFPCFYLDLRTPLFGPLPLVHLLLHGLLNVSLLPHLSHLQTSGQLQAHSHPLCDLIQPHGSEDPISSAVTASLNTTLIFPVGYPFPSLCFFNFQPICTFTVSVLHVVQHCFFIIFIQPDICLCIGLFRSFQFM